MYLVFFGQDRAESFREATTVCFSIVVTEFTDYDSRATGTFTSMTLTFERHLHSNTMMNQHVRA